MELSIHTIHFHGSTELSSLLKKRIQKLETFYQPILRGEAFLKVEKANNRENKHLEVKLYVPGAEFFATAHAQSFETATAKVTESLRRQLKKFKGKQIS